MRYRIEYTGNRKCTVVNSRVALLKELKTAAGVTDVRKIYTNGTTDSVMENTRTIYQEVIHRGRNDFDSEIAVF